MGTQVHKKQVRLRGRSVADSGNTQIIAAPKDADVVQMATSVADADQAEREARVATAAYFRAEKRGFEPGHELEDWLAAEAEFAGTCASSDSPLETLESRSSS
jgi:hypothetical protein